MALRRAARFCFLGLMLVFSLGTFWWMVVASLKSGDDQITSGNPWWTASPDWSTYARLLASAEFGHWMLNTVWVLLATLAISLVASTLAAYALAMLEVPHSRAIALVLFATYILPQGVLFLPLVKMLTRLHLANSTWALVATYPGLVIPFGTWVLWSFIRGLPPEFVESARSEGAGTLRILWSVVLPSVSPAIGAIALFAVAVVFNDFLYAFTFISETSSQTVIGGIATVSTDVGDTGFLFGAGLLGTAPIALLCALFADSYARALGTGFIE